MLEGGIWGREIGKVIRGVEAHKVVVAFLSNFITRE